MEGVDVSTAVAHYDRGLPVQVGDVRRREGDRVAGVVERLAPRLVGHEPRGVGDLGALGDRCRLEGDGQAQGGGGGSRQGCRKGEPRRSTGHVTPLASGAAGVPPSVLAPRTAPHGTPGGQAGTRSGRPTCSPSAPLRPALNGRRLHRRVHRGCRPRGACSNSADPAAYHARGDRVVHGTAAGLMGRRIRWLGVVMVACLGLVVAQLVNIQLVKAKQLQTSPFNPRVAALRFDNPRGEILAVRRHRARPVRADTGGNQQGGLPLRLRSPVPARTALRRHHRATTLR